MPTDNDLRVPSSGRSDESGSATIWGLVAMGMCAAVGWLSLLVATVVAAQHHLDGAADLASLAGASALQHGEDACTAARQTAADNGVRVAACSVLSSDVLVSVEDALSLPFGVPGTLRSAARAGPADVS